ncbi:GTP-binding protein [Candidatus Woesebacteria bacterium]|nr:GTP-binding protein [Candidatus Woesebacteria bacterium]
MPSIRNFAIIAHIDHGKSTLADRLLELTHTIELTDHNHQVLDRNPISRERGITIKLAPVRMKYTHEGVDYILNLIDTPGHVDFSYEVDRTLACVEGVILLVDASQGIQAQTIANAYKALEKNLTIIPVVNKIDLPNAQEAETRMALTEFLGCADAEIYSVSAKTGQGVQELLRAIIQKIAPPTISDQKASRALIFDSYYDTHRGVVAFVRIMDHSMQAKSTLRLCATDTVFEPVEVGYFLPDLTPRERLESGEIGYIATNLKDIHQVTVGDTMVDSRHGGEALGGYRRVKPMVFASLFPTDPADYTNFKKALEKLTLNDAALDYQPIYSQALGAGFRVGFLGLLHADVVRERLEREFDLNIIITPPQVDFIKVSEGIYKEPIVRILIIAPSSYVGAVMKLCEAHRAEFVTMDNKHQVSLTYKMPLAEMISDFFDVLKSATSGYASLDWELMEYKEVKADKLLLLLNGQTIEEFSEIVVADRSYEKGQDVCKRMRALIPRQQYEVKIQAQYKGKIIASERIAPFRKDVLGGSGKNLGSGDVGRRKMLLERQKEGKKKMKLVGKVEIPKDAFQKMFMNKRD